MSRHGDSAPVAVRVVFGIDAGGDVGVQTGGDLVEALQHLGGREVEVGQGRGGGAQAAHRGGRIDAAVHHIAHHERGLVLREGDDVEPVATDLGRGSGGLVAGGDLQTLRRRRLGQEAALERHRGVADALVQARVVEGHCSSVGELTGEGDVVRIEGQLIAAAHQPQDAEWPAPGGQRYREI